MGFGESATQAIFFVASVIIALAIVGTISVSVNSITNSFNGKANHLSNQIKTEISISGDTCYIGGSNYVYVKNIGSSFLDANSSDIYVDGAVQATSAIHIFKNSTWTSYATLNIWEPGQLARFTTTSALPTGYHRMRVVTQYGVADAIEYSDC